MRTSIRSIAVISILFSRFLYLARVTLGLACIHRVFSSRIYVVDSRRDSPVLWEAGRIGFFLVSEPRFSTYDHDL